MSRRCAVTVRQCDFWNTSTSTPGPSLSFDHFDSQQPLAMEARRAEVPSGDHMLAHSPFLLFFLLLFAFAFPAAAPDANHAPGSGCARMYDIHDIDDMARTGSFPPVPAHLESLTARRGRRRSGRRGLLASNAACLSRPTVGRRAPCGSVVRCAPEVRRPEQVPSADIPRRAAAGALAARCPWTVAGVGVGEIKCSMHMTARRAVAPRSLSAAEEGTMAMGLWSFL